MLVAGPTHLDPPAGVEVVRVRSAADMHHAVMARAAGADAVIMAAAVADYTPQPVAEQKIAKSDGGWSLPLVRTIDILADLGRLPSRGDGRPVLVGFAAETHDVIDHAEAKRRRKGVDLIVANDVARADAGFEVDANAVTFVGEDGLETVPLMSKAEVAGANPRPAGTPARRAAGGSGAPLMTRDDLQAHLEYFAELGVDGRAAAIRSGATRAEAAGGADATPRPVPTTAAEDAATTRRRTSTPASGRGAGRAAHRTSGRRARAASCTRSAAARSCSASATRRRR